MFVQQDKPALRVKWTMFLNCSSIHLFMTPNHLCRICAEWALTRRMDGTLHLRAQATSQLHVSCTGVTVILCCQVVNKFWKQSTAQLPFVMFWAQLLFLLHQFCHFGVLGTPNWPLKLDSCWQPMLGGVWSTNEVATALRCLRDWRWQMVHFGNGMLSTCAGVVSDCACLWTSFCTWCTLTRDWTWSVGPVFSWAAGFCGQAMGLW